MLQILPIKISALDFQNPHYIAPLPIRNSATFLKPLQLGKDRVLGGRKIEFVRPALKNDLLLTPRHLRLPERITPAYKHVYLRHCLEMDQVERTLILNSR